MTVKLRPASFVCNHCGAPLESQTRKTTCAYCGAVQFLPFDPAHDIPDYDTGDSHVQAGLNAHAKGNHQLVIEEMETAIRMGVTVHKLTDLYTIVGNHSSDLGNYEKAILNYNESLKIDPNYYKAWVGLGITYRKMGRILDAENCYAEAMRIEPRYAELHSSLGALWIFQGKTQEAIQSLENAISLDPTVQTAHANLALAYAMASRFEEAEKELHQAVVLGYQDFQSIRDRINRLKEMG